MWNYFKVKLVFLGRLCGSVPQSRELVPIWLKSRMPKKQPDDARPIEEIEQEVLDSIEETEERTTLGFQRDDGQLVVRGGTIKAHLKDCANQLREVLKIAALRAKVANKIHVLEYFIPLTNGKPILEETGSFEQPVHVITPMGPRNALKVIKYVEQPKLEFTLKVLMDKEITEDVIRKIFDYGSVHGYGGERGMGEGRYSFEIERIDGEEGRAAECPEVEWADIEFWSGLLCFAAE